MVVPTLKREALAPHRRHPSDDTVLAAMLAQLPLGFAVFDRDLRFVQINERLAAMNGLPAEAHIGRTVAEVVPSLRELTVQVTNRILQTGEPIRNIEFSGETPAAPGEIRYWSESWIPVRDPDGAIVGFGAVIEEITERRRAELAMQESELRFRTLADHVPALVWMVGREGCEFVNRSCLGFLGATMADVRGMGWASYVHPDDRESYAARFLAIEKDHALFEGECRFRRADGIYRWMKTVGVPRFSGSGQYLGYVGYSYDVTDVKAAEHSLREADRRKDEFIAMLAHELRNPLAPIMSAAALLAREGVPAETVASLRGIIERQARHMAVLLDDLLDVSRITSGKLSLRKEPVALSAVIERALETSRPHVDHDLVVSLPSAPVRLEADALRLAQVLSNLLNNACKYTPRGRKIVLSGEQVGDEVVLSVKDSGIGIPPEHLQSVFGMFTQIRPDFARSQAHLGIGLWLCRNLVEMHGGRIEARSEGTGHGSEFVVRLPALPAAAALASAPRADAGENRVAGLRVLVVDDVADNAETLAMLMKIHGNEVRIAGDGVQAVKEAAVFQPDLVLLDIGLPLMNGYDACRAIRREPCSKSAVIVAITGWGQEEDLQQAEDAGFDGHLMKPVEPDKLLALTASLTERIHQGAGLFAEDPRSLSSHRPAH